MPSYTFSFAHSASRRSRSSASTCSTPVITAQRCPNGSMIEAGPAVDFADLAARLGWYDQAHFINDFRSMLGCTPGEYATRHG